MNHELNRLAELLDQINPDNALWIRELLNLYQDKPDAALKTINSQRMWGGAGSIANDALADNPGIDEWVWDSMIREFRSLMIDIAMALKSHDDHYPDIDFWLSSFCSWNDNAI